MPTSSFLGCDRAGAVVHSPSTPDEGWSPLKSRGWRLNVLGRTNKVVQCSLIKSLGTDVNFRFQSKRNLGAHMHNQAVVARVWSGWVLVLLLQEAEQSLYFSHMGRSVWFPQRACCSPVLRTLLPCERVCPMRMWSAWTPGCLSCVCPFSLVEMGIGTWYVGRHFLWFFWLYRVK